MSDPRPVTLRDLAQACGVHLSTISLALNEAPSIPPATRRRIQAMAAKLGYRPNVAARHLAFRRTQKSHAGALPIAWINQEPRRSHWRSDPHARALLRAASRRAEQLGYRLEEIWSQEPGMTPNRVAQIVRARGIEGVIFPVHRSFHFPLLAPAWSELSLVGCNDLRLGEWIDVVCPDHYHNTAVALRRLRQLGYARIGLALSLPFDAATGGLVHGCYLRHQADAPVSDRLPVCVTADAGEPSSAFLAHWLREHRPDAVLCADASAVRSLPDPGFRVEWVPLQGSGEATMGVDEAPAELGRAVVDAIAEKMRRFERGFRDPSRAQLVKGSWREHPRTLREPLSVVA